MPNDLGNNTTNNKNEFPNLGNFSASQNKNITTNTVSNAKIAAAKNGLQTAANAAGPGVGLAANTAMNSKIGNNALNKLKNNSAMGMMSAAGLFSRKNEENNEEQNSDENNEEVTAEQETTDEQPSKVEGNSLVPKEVSNAIKPAIAIGSIGCFGVIVLIIIIACVMLSPIFVVQELISTVEGWWNKIVYFFKGCDNEQECQKKEQDSFYDTLIEVHNEYMGAPYYISLNTELITATLTYYDPMDIMNDETNLEDLEPSKLVDFKKSEKKIRDLAERMVGEGSKCVDLYGNVLVEYKEDEKDKDCPEPILEYYYEGEKQIPNEVTKEDWIYVDNEKYRSYLEDEFIRKFYFNNKNDKETDEEVLRVVDEIYSRVEMVNYLNGSENSSTNFVANNTQVIITDCTGIIELETVSLYEYLQGVLYADEYAINSSEEFLKVQAVVAKNYLYAVNGATPDSIPTTLRIRSCQMNQIYCSVEDGCHNMNDGASDSQNTIAPGADVNGNYYRNPVTDVTILEKIKIAIDSTLSDFIIRDEKFVVTQYRNSCVNLTCDSTTNILDQQAANGMINSGSTYKDVLVYYYNGEIQEHTLGLAVYPLDLIYNNVTSAFGWRVHPTKKVCRTHNGTDIAGDSSRGIYINGANIYSIADGVVVTVDNMPSKINGYGYYMIIGHGSYVDGKYEYYSLYAHQIKMPSLKVGDTVKAGQVIGNVGSTGASTGPHLHIEIYTIQGKNTKVRQDPVEYFKGVELTGQIGGALYGSESQCNSCLNTYGAGNC